MGSWVNGCLSGMLSASNCRASRMPPRGGQSGRNPATQFRIQFRILTVFGGLARTIVFSDIGSKIGFRNRVPNWIRPFRFWDARSDAKLETQWGNLVLCIVGCTTGTQPGPVVICSIIVIIRCWQRHDYRARSSACQWFTHHMGMCSWYCALAVHCKLRRVVMLCSKSIRIILVSVVSLWRLSVSDDAVHGVSRKPPGKVGEPFEMRTHICGNISESIRMSASIAISRPVHTTISIAQTRR